MITSHKISDAEERASSHDKGSRFDATAETVLWCSNYKVVKKRYGRTIRHRFDHSPLSLAFVIAA
jgi:hypothetical protein